MKRILFLSLFLTIIAQLALGQGFTVSAPSAGQTATDLILQKLAGPGVVLSNGKFNGNSGSISTNQQIGTFSRGNVSFPINSGIVMTTGNRSSIPSNASQLSEGEMQSPTPDSCLSTILPGVRLNDLAKLDFDFVAFSDTVAFNYVFASEEYPDYVCSDFNDVFGFFVTGLNPLTGQIGTWNIALLPDGVTPVTINTVNGGIRPPDNYAPCILTNTQYYHTNNSSPIFNGYTTKLTASATITACSHYKMHLAIADVDDQRYDSGVFLEEGSFFSPKMKIRSDYNLPGFGDTLVQNCREADITFVFPRIVIQGNYNTAFTYGGNARPHQDFIVTRNFGTLHNEISDNDPVVFPQGDSLVRIHIAIPETADLGNDIKMVELYLTTILCEEFYPRDTNAWHVDTLRFFLKGHKPIVLKDTTFEACQKCEHLAVELVSGSEPLLYQWTPDAGITNPNARETDANITENKIFQVIAKDNYGCLADTATVKVKINQLPNAEAVIQPEYGCLPLTLNLSAPNFPPTYEFRWNVSTDTFKLESQNQNYNPTLTKPGAYDISLWVSSAPNCNDSIQYPAKVYVSEAPHASFYYVPEEPENGKEVEFYNQTPETNITNFRWNFGDGVTSTEENPIHKYRLNESKYLTATLTVTNEYGCSDDTSAVVPVLDNFAFYVPTSFTPNGDGKNEIFLPKVRDVDSYQLDIFSRNGQLLFHTTDLNEGWDGRYMGKFVPDGVYVWRIKYSRVFNPNDLIPKEGTVTLIR